jgi:nicotinamidase-related amidase
MGTNKMGTNKMGTNKIRRSIRLSNKHIHPYVLCIIDMQPIGFNNSTLIIDNVLDLVREAIVNKAFIIIAQYKGCGETHINIINEIQTYPYKEYIWHNKNDKSKPIQEALKNIFVRQMKVCGVNTEYCVKDTVHGLAKKFPIPIKVIEKACNGTDRIIEAALHKMRTFYKNVEVL